MYFRKRLQGTNCDFIPSLAGVQFDWEDYGKFKPQHLQIRTTILDSCRLQYIQHPPANFTVHSIAPTHIRALHNALRLIHNLLTQDPAVPGLSSGSRRVSRDIRLRSGAGIMHTADIVASEGLVARYRPPVRSSSLGHPQPVSGPAVRQSIEMEGAQIPSLWNFSRVY